MNTFTKSIVFNKMTVKYYPQIKFNLQTMMPNQILFRMKWRKEV